MVRPASATKAQGQSKSRLAAFSSSSASARKSFPGATASSNAHGGLAPGSATFGKSSNMSKTGSGAPRARFLEKALVEAYLKVSLGLTATAKKATGTIARKVLLEARNAINAAKAKALTASRAHTHKATAESVALAERLEEQKRGVQEELQAALQGMKKQTSASGNVRAAALSNFKNKSKAMLARFKQELMA